MDDIFCPCGHEFEGPVWEPGECPKCGLEYYWEEFCTEDYSDCWAEIFWDGQ